MASLETDARKSYGNDLGICRPDGKTFREKYSYRVTRIFRYSRKSSPKPQKFGSEVGAIKAHASAELSTRWTDAKVFVGGGDSHFLHMGASGNSSAKVVVSAGSSTPISLLSKTIGTSTLLQPWKSTSFEDSMYFLEGNLGYQAVSLAG